ncbi:diacylglycerol kinase family protein [Anaerorhabdus sp.]|jgi:diacylglycerol kinase|uniref:diacylglycerol kinase family protein n=1 Tax=Anaerorhabdus sp. TaxID=1872524 RepID=UPI002FC63751
MNKFKVAFNGFIETLYHRSVRIQMILMVGTILVAFALQFTYEEWLVVGVCCGLVITTEIINTCIEKICDVYTTEFDERIKSIKDMSAGAVLFAATVSLVLGVMILLNHIGG